MKAMILSAGLGTRLRPLTDSRPKALVEISGRTLLEINLTRLRTFGIHEVILNVHHFSDMVVNYLRAHNNFGMRIEISREEILLDTGGGLKQASWFFLEDQSNLDEPFLLHNVDVVSTIDFATMLQFHKDQHALATLAVQSRDSSRQLLFDNNLQLSGRRKSRDEQPEIVRGPLSNSPREGTTSVVPEYDPERGALAPEVPTELEPLAFSGIHLISPRLLPLITETGIFSIIDTYLRLAAQHQKILAFRSDQYYWRDLGRPSDLSQAAEDLAQNLFS
jgi:NDP-sugar pyrophosphorylase family protein